MQPKYVILANALRDKIRSGEYPAGGSIPSEHELARQFDVSIVTVRKALEELCYSGLIQKSKGRCAIVRQTAYLQDLSIIHSYTEEITRHNMQPTRTVLKAVLRDGTIEECSQLELPVKSKVFELERIYYADEVSLCHTVSVLPQQLFPGVEKQDFTHYSLYELLHEIYGLQITFSTVRMRAVNADNQMVQCLGIPYKHPLLLFNALTYGVVNGRECPIEIFTTRYRTDRFEYTLTHRR